jgi:hypothetical protein
LIDGAFKKVYMRAKAIVAFYLMLSCLAVSSAYSQGEIVKLVKNEKQKKVDVFVGNRFFTTFMYTDSIEKPVLYPIASASGTVVTRGFPLKPQPGDPTDHPHHLGLWLNFENVNGLDFWNNSYAIPPDKKSHYGWIKTDRIIESRSGPSGVLSYHANWTNQKGDVLLQETTRFEFTGKGQQRIIDRTTVLKADTTVLFKDAKDGLLGLRVAHALQIPTTADESFTDDKGNVTVVKGGTDKIPNGNYLTSEGKQGNDAWSTRATWCKMYGKVENDSISITIFDHPKNPNYPTFWHARGYGLFAANPLGEKVFTNGKSEKNLQLQKGESVTFKFRVVIDGAAKTPSVDELNKLATEFARK